mmetsp:Transcript_4108/g.8868  ORF Transcript_4108/g.8868 Transcript_4108/m.8868 type:complete len:1132 (+) Transcript_4108:483-3878(+)
MPLESSLKRVNWPLVTVVLLAVVYVVWSETERRRLLGEVENLQVSSYRTQGTGKSSTFSRLPKLSGNSASKDDDDDDDNNLEGENMNAPLLEIIMGIPLDIYIHSGLFILVFGWLVKFIWNELALVSVNRLQEQGDDAHDDSKSHLDGFNSVHGPRRHVRPKSIEQRRIRERIHDTLTFSLREFIFYRMDYLLSTWSSAKPVALLLATYLLIMSGATLYWGLNSGSDVTYSESVWMAWTFVADPGTHAEERGLAERLVALLLTIGGMLIFALMIGIIAESVSDLLDDLKKGRSRVIESGHTLILGWSDKVIPTIRELAIANESEGGGVVVLLCERQKEEMENALASALTPEHLYGTKVICRSGSPLIMTDLLKVSAQTAKAVIVLSDPDVDADESDARAVRIVMSLTGIDVRCHIVVEMCDVDNRELVMLVGKGNVETVVAHDIIGRLMIQCARQPGLAQILEQLLGFAGDEFYLEEWPQLTGKTFLDASFVFDQAVPIGIKPADPELAAQQLQLLKRLDSPPLSPMRSRSSHGSRGSLNSTAAEIINSGRSLRPPPLRADPESLRRDHRSSSDPTPTHRRKSSNQERSQVGGHSRGSSPAPGNRSMLPGLAIPEPNHERLYFPYHEPQNAEEDDVSDEEDSTSEDDTSSTTMRAPTPLNIAKRTISVNSGHSARSRAGSMSSVFGNGPRTVLLNPPDGYVLQKGDQILVIAEDDDSYDASSDGEPVNEAAQRARFSVNAQHPMHFIRKPERLLFCGWRRDMDDMISELDKLVVKNSELVLMSTIPTKTRLRKFKDANKVDLSNLRNLRIVHEEGNPVLRRHLERLALEDYSSILILADEAFETNMQTADSRSLASMLLIRDIIEKRHAQTIATMGDIDPSLIKPLTILTRRSSSPAPRRFIVLHDQMRNEQDAHNEKIFVPERDQPDNDDDERKGTATPSSDANSSDDDQLNDLISGIQCGKLYSPVEAAQRRLQRQTTAEARQEIKRSWCPREHHMEREDPGTIIISEILDSRTKSLISVAEVSDYVMSNEIVACAMAMVAEDRSINIVLTELLSASGCEIQVRSCLEYCEPGEVLDWWTIMARARKRCEVAIGYRPRDETEALLNPRKKSKLRVWARGDSIVVLTSSP